MAMAIPTVLAAWTKEAPAVKGAKRTPSPSVIAAVLGLVQKLVSLSLVMVLAEVEDGWG